MNDAVTITSLSIVTLQVVPDEEVQPPAHPRNVWPAFGAATRATDEPVANAEEHVDPQLMPAGVLVIVPSAAPLVTSTERFWVEVPCGQP